MQGSVIEDSLVAAVKISDRARDRVANIMPVSAAAPPFCFPVSAGLNPK
jgi:hypothetical protein